MYCRNCGTRLPDGSAVCPKCGEVLRAQPQGGSGYEEAYTGRTEKKKGFPIVALISLIVVAVVALFVYMILKPEFKGDSDKRYGGAKVKKQKIWDTDLLTVTAEGIDRASGEYYYCDAIGLTIQNKSGSPISVDCISLTVNGAAMQPVLKAKAAPGETVKAELVMDNYTLDDMAIRTISDFTMELAASDPAGGGELARSGVLTVETTKKGKGDTPGFKYEARPIYEEKGIRIGTNGFRTVGTTMRYGVCFNVENNSGETIRVVARDIVLNDLPHGDTTEASFQTGAPGVFYVKADFEELEKIDKERDFFPVTKITGNCDIFSAADGRKIASFPFEYQK
ncbi:MAG: zinc ribbon domain-containing protein [Stomatobaculum sp.]|nr:zinc ribbon domain-containing protein [Stomatobaculum sp.]